MIKILCLLFSSLCYGHLHVYLATPKDAVGERNQLLSLAHALGESEKNVTLREFPIQSAAILKRKLAKEIQPLSKERYVLLTSGKEGGTLLAQWNRGSGVLKKVHLSHQELPEHEKISQFIDLCVLPKHVWSPRFEELKKNSKCRWVQTVGVLHGLSAEDLKLSFRKSGSLIPRGESYVVAILGGDAPDPSGKILFFSKEDAESLAILSSQKASRTNAVLIGMNGPRTGRYLRAKEVLLDTKAHRKGVIDPITQTFWEKVKEKLPQEQRVLFDFQYGKASPYQAVLGALLERGGDLYVPGDSTSMVSEAADLFPGRVFVYETQAMNPSHQAHIRSEQEAGRILWIPRGARERKSLTTNSSKQTSQVKQLAEEVLKLWE